MCLALCVQVWTLYHTLKCYLSSLVMKPGMPAYWIPLVSDKALYRHAHTHAYNQKHAPTHGGPSGLSHAFPHMMYAVCPRRCVSHVLCVPCAVCPMRCVSHALCVPCAVCPMQAWKKKRVLLRKPECEVAVYSMVGSRRTRVSVAHRTQYATGTSEPMCPDGPKQ